MDLLSGLLGGLGGLSSLYNGYQNASDDSWLKKLLSSSSSGGTGQTLTDENLLRDYLGYGQTTTDPATLSTPTGISTADENLLRSYFGYDQAQPTSDADMLKKYFGGQGSGYAKQSSDGTSGGSDSTRLSTGGGTGQNSKRNYSRLLSDLWRPAQTGSPFSSGIGIDPVTGLMSMGGRS